MQIVVTPLDRIAEAYGKALAQLGTGKARVVMARAMTYEGQKAFTQVKRDLQKQTSIPRGHITSGTSFKKAGQGDLTTIIKGTGRPLPLKEFGARQFNFGVRAKVWGQNQRFPGAFMGPKPGTIASKLGGHAYHRTQRTRLPIEKMYGPSIPREIVKDQAPRAYYDSVPLIAARVGKEIAAALRGY